MKLFTLIFLGCLPFSLCGSIFNAQGRVFGGRNATEEEFPYQAELLENGYHGCGGTIVGREWIVTAAHCVFLTDINILTVRVGSNALTTGGAIYQTRKIIVHPNFGEENGENDIALLQVEPIEFTNLVKPIEVERRNIEENVPVVLTGWGSSVLGGPSAAILQAVDLRTITVADCAANFPKRPVTEKHVCTFTKIGEGSCHGDSGGPLVTTIEGSDRKLVGVVSWGEPCAVGKPDVFTRVTSYIDWISIVCDCNV